MRSSLARKDHAINALLNFPAIALLRRSANIDVPKARSSPIQM